MSVGDVAERSCEKPRTLKIVRFLRTKRARKKNAKTLCPWLSPGNPRTRSAKKFREFCLSAVVDGEHDFERRSAKKHEGKMRRHRRNQAGSSANNGNARRPGTLRRRQNSSRSSVAVHPYRTRESSTTPQRRNGRVRRDGGCRDNPQQQMAPRRRGSRVPSLRTVGSLGPRPFSH